jgi:hypothetical protein
LEQQSLLFLQEAPSGEHMGGVAVGVTVGVGVWADAGAAFAAMGAKTNAMAKSRCRDWNDLDTEKPSQSASFNTYR